MTTSFLYPDLSQKVLNAAYTVHRNLGPGLLESTYEACLEHELLLLGLSVHRQKKLPLQYGTVFLEEAYRIDLLIENQIIIEIKSASGLEDVHFKQLLTYLKLSGIRVGYLINFNCVLLKENLFRKIY